MEEDINASYAERAIAELRKVSDKKEQEITELNAQIEILAKSTKREDRDKVKQLKAKVSGLTVQINKHLTMIANTIEAIDEKRANMITWEKKIDFIKKEY